MTCLRLWESLVTQHTTLSPTKTLFCPVVLCVQSSRSRNICRVKLSYAKGKMMLLTCWPEVRWGEKCQEVLHKTLSESAASERKKHLLDLQSGWSSQTVWRFVLFFSPRVPCCAVRALCVTVNDADCDHIITADLSQTSACSPSPTLQWRHCLTDRPPSAESRTRDASARLQHFSALWEVEVLGREKKQHKNCTSQAINRRLHTPWRRGWIWLGLTSSAKSHFTTSFTSSHSANQPSWQDTDWAVQISVVQAYSWF